MRIQESSWEEYLGHVLGVSVCLWLHRIPDKNLTFRDVGPPCPQPTSYILTLHLQYNMPYNGCIPFGQPSSSTFTKIGYG